MAVCVRQCEAYMQNRFALRAGKVADTAKSRPLPSPTASIPAPCTLELIYRQERAGLLRYLRREVGDDLAADIMQEVFLRAAASPQLPTLLNPGGFLHRIARNILIDRSRRRRCQVATMPLIEAIDAPSAADQENGLMKADLEILLEHALQDLSHKTRSIFTMHRTKGMTYREIQCALGISIAAVEYHMMKALAHLRLSLGSLC